MDPREQTRQSGFHRRELRRSAPITSRPDRVAMWAVVMAVVAMLAAAGSSHGSSGADHPASSGEHAAQIR